MFHNFSTSQQNNMNINFSVGDQTAGDVGECFDHRSAPLVLTALIMDLSHV